MIYVRTVTFGIIASSPEDALDAWDDDGPELGPNVHVLASSNIEAESLDPSEPGAPGNDDDDRYQED